MPLKNFYYLEDFWNEFTQGSLYKAYAKANPIESAGIAEIAKKKIDEKPWTGEALVNAKTHTGKALSMVILAMAGGHAPTT